MSPTQWPRNLSAASFSSSVECGDARTARSCSIALEIPQNAVVCGPLSEPRTLPGRAISRRFLPLSAEFSDATEPGRLGTDVERSVIPRVGAPRRGSVLEDFRSGGVNRDRTGRFSVSASGRTADPSWGDFDRPVVTRRGRSPSAGTASPTGGRLSAVGRRRRQWRPERLRTRAAAEARRAGLKCGDIESGSSHFLPLRPCQGSGPGSRPAATSASRPR